MSTFSWGENAEVRVWEVRPGRAGVGIRSALKFGLVDHVSDDGATSEDPIS